MTRTPFLKPEEMSPDQRRIYEEIYASRGTWLNGPFAPMLHSPPLADSAQKLGEFVRYHTSLPPVLTELAIIMVARHYDCPFEWVQHARIALAAGVPAEVVEAIRNGKSPAGQAANAQIIYDFAHALLTTNRIPDKLYDAARSAFGVTGVVELVGLMGYYTLIAFCLNAHEVPMPAGAESQLPDLRHPPAEPSDGVTA